MRSRSDLHLYQERAIGFMLDHPFCYCWLGMGLGKSVSTLTAIDTLQSWCEVSKPLIIAPRLVTEMTWLDEIQEWDFTSHLKLSRIIGTPAQRKRALTAEADIWIISRDNLAWLVDLLGTMWPFDMVVLDESTSFKSHDSLRFKKMDKVMSYGIVHRMIQLTGTPAPNGLMDLWAPMYLLDRGARLGTTITGYRTRYFSRNEYEQRYELRPGGEQSIYEKISDLGISMREEDWLDLKPVENITRRIELPDMQAYRQFEEDAVLALENAEITAFNAASLYGKLLQYCNGAIYDENHQWHLVHDAKLDMLEEMIDTLNGNPVIVFYCFQSDLARIQERIKNTRKMEGTKEKDDWNEGKIPVLLAHPASASHGLNMQKGGWNIIWYGIPSNLEHYQQAIKRLARQGQKNVVINNRLIAKGTLEEKVAVRLEDKIVTQDLLMEAVKAFKNDIAERRKKKILSIPAVFEEDWVNS